MMRSLVVLLLVAAPALASSNYPSEVKTHLEAAAIPQCTICHDTNAGGFGTVNQPFGVALMDNGLVSGDVEALGTALDAVEAAGTDSDGDGVGDVDEVRAGADPNDGADGGVAADAETLLYGFGCAAGGTPAALVLLLGLLRRRRRRAAR